MEDLNSTKSELGAKADDGGKKLWNVSLPIAGHVVVMVEADDEESAIDAAMETATLNDIEDWEALRQFNQGNVCYCPRPWEAEAIDETPDDPA